MYGTSHIGANLCGFLNREIRVAPFRGLATAADAAVETSMVGDSHGPRVHNWMAMTTDVRPNWTMDIYGDLWRFPEMEKPPVIIHF